MIVKEHGKKFWAEYTQWKSPPSSPEQYCNLYTSVWLVSKGGKRILQDLITCGIVNTKELKRNSAKQIEKAKKVKERDMKETFCEYLKNMVGTRRGFGGYRGYFRIVDIEQYKAEY